MSAFNVSCETINRVVHLLTEDGRKAGDDPQQLGDRLQRLNAESVRSRYGSDAMPVDAMFDHHASHYTDAEKLGAAHCWLYQCSESDELMDTPIYHRVQGVALGVASAMLRQSGVAMDWDAPRTAETERPDALAPDASQLPTEPTAAEPDAPAEPADPWGEPAL